MSPLPSWPDLPTTRTATATLFRGYLTVISEMGHFAAIRRRVRPHVAELMSNPPFPTRWMSSRDHEEVIEGLSQVAGDSAVRTLGHQTSLKSCGPLVIPIAKTLMAISGRSPRSIYSRLGSVTTAILRGTSTEYAASSSTSGVVKVVTDDYAPRSNFLFWQGALLVAFDLCGTPGTASEPTLEAGNCIARFDVNWGTKTE